MSIKDLKKKDPQENKDHNSTGIKMMSHSKLKPLKNLRKSLKNLILKNIKKVLTN